MTKPYDSTSKFLLEEFPGDWLALAGLTPRGPIELIDANLSTITAEADKVIRVGGPSPWLAHFELQASRDPRIGSRLFRYNALLDDRHDLPTRSVVVLLRPEADGPELTGEYRRSLPDGPDYLNFRYEVLRVWQEPVATFLDGGLGTLPLAPVANLGTTPIEEVIREIDRRIDQSPPDLVGLLWSSTSILMGLRYPAAMIDLLVRGARQMKESTYYQFILAEGEAKGVALGEARGQARGLLEGRVSEALRLLVRQGERRFGPASVADLALLNAITQIDRLEALIDLLVDAPVTTWPEFWDLAQGINP